MEPPVKRIGDVTIERVTTESNPKNDDSSTMNFDSESDSETPVSEDDLNLDPPIDLEDKNHASSSLLQIPTSSQKRKNEFQIISSGPKKTKTKIFTDSDSDLMNIDSELHKSAEDLNDFEVSVSENKSEVMPRTHLSDNEDSEYDSEEESDNEEQNLKLDPPKAVIDGENTDFIDKLSNELGESSSQKSEDAKMDGSDYDYDITEKLKEMGEISVETVKKGDKPRKSDATEETENEISVTPAKKDSGSDSEDKLSSEKKIGNMRRNIREVMDETQLDEATLAAQRQEMERLRRVQEQQRIIREVQRQIALNRQNNKTQHRVISLLQGNSTLIKQIPGTSSSRDATPSASGGPTMAGGSAMGPQSLTGTSSATIGSKIGGTVLVKLPNGETKPMTRITKSGAPFEVVRLQKGALQGKVQRNLIPIKKTSGGNLTPSVSIAPVSKKIEPKLETDSDSDFSESEKKVRKVAGKPKDVVTISSSSDDDCIVLSEDEPEEPEPEEDPCNSGMHTNDAYNVPDEQGRVLINVGHPENEAEIFLAPQIARVIKPHQIGGVRFLFDNVIESTDRFSTSTGFGCILAHSMGLGKTLQIVCFSDIFLRHTDAKTILCIMPINTLQNWMAEYNMWLPKDTANSPLLSHGEVRPRNFNIFVLNDSHKTLVARSKVIQEWHRDGGVLLIGYELYRLLSLRRNPKSKKKKKPAGSAPDRPETPEDEEKNKSLFEEIHEALVKPGPDLVICDEGHRIKNSHASISLALKQIRSKRRIVLTGYPLQNNLLEYWCMVDFVRPNYLGTKTEFSNMFERPIQNGQCIDSTPQDIRLMRYRAHVLHSLLEGFVQRRSHAVLQTSLPQKEEYVLQVRMTEFQRKLYDTFMNEVVRTKTVPNPLKAFAVCCKIWNHPDVLYYFLKKQTAGEAVDLDLEEVAGAVPGAQTPTQTTPKKGSTRSKGGKKEKKTAASKSSSKPAASVTPNTNATTTQSNTTSSTANPQNIPPMPPNQFPQNSQAMPPPNMTNVPANPMQNPPNYQQINQNYPNAPYPYPQQNYNQYSQNGDYYNQNQNYPNNYNPNYYPNQEYQGFYPENKPEGYNIHAYQHNEQNYWQNNQQNNQYYQNNGSQNDYYSNMNQQQNYNNQWNQYNQNYPQNNLYPNSNNPYPQNQGWNPSANQNDVKPEFPKQEFPEFDPKHDPKHENIDNKIVLKQDVDNKDLKPDEKMKIDLNVDEDKKGDNTAETKEENEEKEKDVDIKNAEMTAAAMVKKEDPGIPYDWAQELMKGYIPGCIENSAKMEIFFCILQESIALGDRILLFSQSLFTLNLIEEFLQKNEVPGTSDKWAKNKNYYRLDGSTSALEREKLINEYNSNPNIHLFLVSTRAGSLGINLVGANRVIVFDASWNPCHDTQAVCRVYRYGQKKPCFVYRIVMDNCLEKKIYDRQINKQGMADRVVDECNPDAHLSMKDVTNLCWDDEKETEVKDFSTTKDKYIDVVMQKVLDAYSTRLSKEPFQHESLLIDRKEKKLSQAEKRLAKRSYELEKQANINSRPAYNYYNSGSGQGLQIRAIRSADGSVLQNKPVASVRPMQSEQLVRDLGRPGAAGATGRSRWIPAEVWQRQGMTAQEMTLPLDVVIPTNSPDRGSIVLKAGQKVLVLKSPKGIYMQLECGKIVAIKTAFKVRGGKAPEKGDEGSKEPSTPTTILKKIPQGANTSKNTGNVPLPLKNNTAITVIPKGGQQRLVKPFTQGVTKLNMRSIRQPVPNLIGRQVPMRLGGPRFTGKIQSIHRKVQLAKAKPYNLDKTDSLVTFDPSKIKTEPSDQHDTEPHVVPSSDEEIPPESQTETSDKKSESPVPSECADSESFPINDQFSESEKSIENCSDMERLSSHEFPENSEDRRPSTESYQSSEKLSSDGFTTLDNFQNNSASPEKFATNQEQFPGSDKQFLGPEMRFPGPEKQFIGQNNQFPGPEKQFAPEARFTEPETRFPGPEKQFSGPDRFPGPEKQFPGPETRFPGPDKQFAGPDRFAGPEKQFSGPETRFPGPEKQFVGPENQFPGPDKQFAGPDRFAGPEKQFPGPDRFPGPEKQFPGPETRFPGPEKQFAGPETRFPGPEKQFAGPETRFPVPEKQFAGPENQFPGPEKQFSGPDRFPGPDKQFPGPESQFPGPEKQFSAAEKFPNPQNTPEIYPALEKFHQPSPEQFPQLNQSKFPQTSPQNPPNFHQIERYPQNFDKFPIIDKSKPVLPPQKDNLGEKPLPLPLPPLVETKKALPTFQVQNAPQPISSAVVHESGNTSRSLKNYRHNFASQKATKAQIKSAATSSALHQLEQTTSSIGENKQPFQESLDIITNSYGNAGNDAKSDEGIIDLEEKTDGENMDKSKIGSNKQPSPPCSKPSAQPKPETIPQPLPAPPPGPIQPPPLLHTSQVPPLHTSGPQQVQPANQQQHEFPPAVAASYGGYYGYGGPHGGPHVQPYPPPPQAYYPTPEIGHFGDKTKEREKGAINPSQNVSAPPRQEPPQSTTDLTSVQTTPAVQSTAAMPPATVPVPSIAPIASVPSGTSVPSTPPASSAAPGGPTPIQHTSHGAHGAYPTPGAPGAPGVPPAGTFAPYGQPGMPPPPHGGYDMMYGQQNQYGANYPGLPYPNQPNYQPPYQQYDQNYPPGTPAAPNMYSAFHRPEVHHQYPTDPYGQYGHVRNYPPQYGYPPPGAAPHGQYPGGPTAGYDYQYNAGAFPPPPPPFVGPYTGLPNNNAAP